MYFIGGVLLKVYDNLFITLSSTGSCFKIKGGE